MSKVHIWLLLVALVVAGLVATAAGQPKDEKPGHSRFYGDFSAEAVVASCGSQLRFVKDKPAYTVCEGGILSEPSVERPHARDLLSR
jgi:hypothetical protein